MRVILSPDSFKGSLTAAEAARAMARGVKKIFAQAELVELPLADGGEGTVETLLALGGKKHSLDVTGPLPHLRVKADWAMLPNGTAVLESAAASGLTLIPPDELDAGAATSFGTGELLLDAFNKGAKKVILGLGGSAMTDGGTGFLCALGVRFLDAGDRPLPLGGIHLTRLAKIDSRGLDIRVRKIPIIAATDVNNPLCGPQGAAMVFGPQKGASPKLAAELDAALAHYAFIATDKTNRNIAAAPGTGAAGGLGAAMLWFTEAKLTPGAEYVLEALNFDSRLQGADLVITGEGQSDAQSARGKLPSAVARAADRRGVPCICISGALGEGHKELYMQGLDAAMATPPGPASLEECLKNAARQLEDATERACRLLKTGLRLKKEE